MAILKIRSFKSRSSNSLIRVFQFINQAERQNQLFNQTPDLKLNFNQFYLISKYSFNLFLSVKIVISVLFHFIELNFLLIFQLGIEIRRKTLLEHNSENEEVRKEIETSFDFLVDPNQMGERFKFFSIFPKTMEEIHQKFPPVGFYQTRDKQ